MPLVDIFALPSCGSLYSNTMHAGFQTPVGVEGTQVKEAGSHGDMQAHQAAASPQLSKACFSYALSCSVISIAHC